MSGNVKSAQAVTATFVTSAPTTGAATNADSLPTGTLYVNGAADGATVTVTNITTGRYKAAVTLPSLAAGDVVDLHIAATVSTVAGGGIVWSAIGDTKRTSDTLSSDVVAISGDSAAADNLEAAADGSGYNLGGGSVVAASVTGAVGSVAAGGITASSIAADAIGASELAADAVAEIQSGLATSSALSTLSTTVSGLAAAVWAYATRTLTQGAASVVAAVTGSSVTVYRGTRWSIPLTGLPSNTGYTSILFSVKPDDGLDSAAICTVRKNASGTGDGLIYFTGATVVAAQASITVVSATALTIIVEAATTVYASPGSWRYGIKYLDASGYPSQASIGGVLTVVADIPKAIV